MVDRLSAMAVFAAVVEAEGFSAAARELGVSKSAISKQVGRLEDRLGVRLLNRTTRRLSITEAGAAFFQGCQRVVSEAQAAEQAITHLAAAPRGRLKVNAPMSFGIRHVCPALPDFLARYSEVSVDLVLNDRLVNLVEEGFDLGVRITRMDDAGLIARRLAPSRAVLCAAPAYLARAGIPVSLEDLGRHECLLYSYQASGGTWRFHGPGGEQRVRAEGRFRVNNGDGLLAAALAGLGVAVLPSFICGEELRAGRLVHLLPEWSALRDRAVHAVYPAGRNLSPKVRVFIDFLAERFGPTPYWDHGLGA